MWQSTLGRLWTPAGKVLALQSQGAPAAPVGVGLWLQVCMGKAGFQLTMARRWNGAGWGLVAVTSEEVSWRLGCLLALLTSLPAFVSVPGPQRVPNLRVD